MTQKITFQKSKETDAVQILNAAGVKTGLKEVDELILANPQTDHKDDWIFRVKVVPFDLSLNGEKRKVETIDFFVNANAGIEFFLKNALKNETTFELQWIEELVGKSIGFSENRPNTLVVESIPLRYEAQQTQTALDLEVDWKSITEVEGGFIFPLTSPISISLKNHNFTYDKVFWDSPAASKDSDFIKQRLNEWKADQKPFKFYEAFLSFDNWLSVKDSKNLYIVGHKGKYKENDLTAELTKETPFLEGIAGWLKLPYHQREKFIKRYWKGNEKVEDMKNEIEAAIRGLESDNPTESPSGSADNKELKIFLWIGGIIFAGLLIILIYRNYRQKKKQTKK